MMVSKYADMNLFLEDSTFEVHEELNSLRFYCNMAGYEQRDRVGEYAAGPTNAQIRQCLDQIVIS